MNLDFYNNLNNIIFNSNNHKINSLYSNMSNYQRKIFDSFKENPALFYDYSLNDLLFDFDKDFVEHILSVELDIYLSEHQDNNKRNGYTHDIDLTSEDRKLVFNRPRLRNEKNFDSVLIPKRTRVINDLKNNIILLYSKNNSLNDIKDILANMFSLDISIKTISNLVNEISEEVLKWRNKQLKKCYFCINIDCTYISIRDQKYLNSHSIPIYIAVGTDLCGHKSILGIYLGNEDENKNIIDNLYNKNIGESKNYWINVFEDLKDRGVEKVLYVSSDGIGEIENGIKHVFPSTHHQRCIVHLSRNLREYAPKSLKNDVVKDFKAIYSAENKEIACLKIEEFKTIYQKNPTILKHAEEYFTLVLPLFDLPENIRKYIYTNNISESVNSKLQRGFYGRGALPNANSAINIIFLNLTDLEKKWSKTKVNNWDKIYNEIIQLYYEDIKQYLD